MPSVKNLEEGTWMVLNESLMSMRQTWNNDLLQIERTKCEKWDGEAVGADFGKKAVGTPSL